MWSRGNGDHEDDHQNLRRGINAEPRRRMSKGDYETADHPPRVRGATNDSAPTVLAGALRRDARSGSPMPKMAPPRPP